MKKIMMSAAVFLFAAGLSCAGYCQDYSEVDADAGQEVDSEQAESQEELSSVDEEMGTDPS